MQNAYVYLERLSMDLLRFTYGSPSRTLFCPYLNYLISTVYNLIITHNGHLCGGLCGGSGRVLRGTERRFVPSLGPNRNPQREGLETNCKRVQNMYVQSFICVFTVSLYMFLGQIALMEIFDDPIAAHQTHLACSGTTVAKRLYAPRRVIDSLKIENLGSC